MSAPTLNVTYTHICKMYGYYHCVGVNSRNSRLVSACEILITSGSIQKKIYTGLSILRLYKNLNQGWEVFIIFFLFCLLIFLHYEDTNLTFLFKYNPQFYQITELRLSISNTVCTQVRTV